MPATHQAMMQAVKAGSYQEAKLCVLTVLRLPIVGRVYRLLNDDFKDQWKLVVIDETDVLLTCHFIRVVPVQRRQMPSQSSHYRGVWGPASVEDLIDAPQMSDRTRVDFSPQWFNLTFGSDGPLTNWIAALDTGAVVVDGDDLPEGNVREWAVRKRIPYVLGFESFRRIAKRIAAGTGVRLDMPSILRVTQ